MNRLYANEFKAISNVLCQDQTKKLALVYFLCYIVNFIFISYSLVSIIVFRDTYFAMVGIIVDVLLFIIEPAILFSQIMISKKIYTKQNFRVSNVLYGFFDYARAALVYLIKGTMIIIGLLLFIFPGIYVWFTYSMTEYIMLDNPEFSILKSMTESRKMMKHHKLEYLELVVSFLLYLFLILITLGVASIWLLPKMRMCEYLFYVHISGMDQDRDLEELLKEGDQFLYLELCREKMEELSLEENNIVV